MELLQKIESKNATIGIVGLGYVGLPLMMEFVEEGFTTIGFDVDDEQVQHVPVRKRDRVVQQIVPHPIEVMRDPREFSL